MNKMREVMPLQVKKSKIIYLFLYVSLTLMSSFVITYTSFAAIDKNTYDLNVDASVNQIDLTLLIQSYGQTPTNSRGDLDGNGKIDTKDVSIFLTNYKDVSTPTTRDPEGKIKFVLRNSGATDSFVGDKNPATQAWIKQHYWRMEVFASYFWDKTSWYKNGWNYKDATSAGGVYSVIGQHQDWILRDSSGNKLYIPWGCEDGLCDSNAIDVGNPAFRQEWIRQAKAEIAGGGYKGIWIDDVNMDWRVSDRYGNHVLPLDPRTGTTMTIDNWRKYLAEFMEQIRAEIPDAELLHNTIWYAGAIDGSRLGVKDPYIQRQIKAANYINREAGFNDGGLTNGNGTYSYNTLLSFIDTVHSLGKHVVIDSFTGSEAAREYGIAGYYLTSDGYDGYGNNDASYPSNWWSGYDTNLGYAKGNRYLWNNLWRRDFDKGTVLVNAPNSPSNGGDLGSTYKRINGQQVRNVSLQASQGIILLK